MPHPNWPDIDKKILSIVDHFGSKMVFFHFAFHSHVRPFVSSNMVITVEVDFLPYSSRPDFIKIVKIRPFYTHIGSEYPKLCPGRFLIVFLVEIWLLEMKFRYLVFLHYPVSCPDCGQQLFLTFTSISVHQNICFTFNSFQYIILTP